MWELKLSCLWLGLFLVQAALSSSIPQHVRSPNAGTTRSSLRTLLNEGKARFQAEYPDAKLWKIVHWALANPYAHELDFVEVSNPQYLNTFFMYFYSPTIGYRILHSQASPESPQPTWEWPPTGDFPVTWYPWREITWPPKIDIFDADSDSKKQGETRKYTLVKYHKNDDLEHVTPFEAYTFGKNIWTKLWALKVDDGTVVDLTGVSHGSDGSLTIGGSNNSNPLFGSMAHGNPLAALSVEK